MQQSERLKVFKTNIWSLYQNILQKMGRRNSFLQLCLLTRSNLPHFCIKKESVIILKMTKFWRKIWLFLMTSKEIEIYSPDNTFVNKETFFPRWLFWKTSLVSISMPSGNRDERKIRFFFHFNNQTTPYRLIYWNMR